MASLSRLEALLLNVTSYMLNNCSIVQIKQNLVLVDRDAHQRETITKWPI